MTSRLPAVFIGHGSPMNTLERNGYTEAWRALGRQLPRPQALLVISAHWFFGATAVGGAARTAPAMGGAAAEVCMARDVRDPYHGTTRAMTALSPLPRGFRSTSSGPPVRCAPRPLTAGPTRGNGRLEQ